MAAVEIDELSIEHMVTGEEEGLLEEAPPCVKVKNILNICLTIFITVNLALEFEGQPSNFAFITDAVNCGLFLCCLCVLALTIVTKIKY